MVKKFAFIYLVFYSVIGFTLVSCSKEEAVPITADFQITYIGNDQSAPVKVKITNLTKGADTYHWTFEGAETAASDSQNPGTITYLHSGTFSILLEASNRDGIHESKEVNVQIFAALSVDFETQFIIDNFPPATVHCNNLSNGASQNTWQFEGGNPATSTTFNPQDVVFAEPGLHPITLQVSNGLETIQITKSVEVAPHLVAGFDYTVSYQDSDMQAPVSIQMLNNSMSATQFTWSATGANISNSNSTAPIITFSNSGTYTVQLSATNGKETQTVQQTFTILPNTNLRTIENLKLGINTAHTNGVFPAFYSTQIGMSYFSNQVNANNGSLIDLVFYGLNADFGYNKFVSPQQLSSQTNFSPIPNAVYTKFINVLENCGCSASMSVSEFDNLTNGDPLEGIIIEETSGGSQYFNNAVVPRIILFETADDRKGAIKIKEYVANGTSSYIIVDIKVQKE